MCPASLSDPIRTESWRGTTQFFAETAQHFYRSEVVKRFKAGENQCGACFHGLSTLARSRLCAGLTRLPKPRFHAA